MIITDNLKNGIYYSGASEKFGVTINNKYFIVKVGQRDTASSITEYIASHIIEKLGVSVHKTIAAKYMQKPATLIYDFALNNGVELHEFKDTKQSSIDTDISNKNYTYKDVTYIIEKHLKIKDRNKTAALDSFWKMFICDAILGNRDRHWGNWGFIKTKDNDYIFAPVYDNGNSLFPNMFINGVHFNNLINKNRYEFFKHRTIDTPASLFQVTRPDRTYRTNYYQILGDLRVNKLLAYNVKAIKEKIGYKDILNIAISTVADAKQNYTRLITRNETSMLAYDIYDDTLWKFWIEIIVLRYMVLIQREPFYKAFQIIERYINQ